jgi:hypothetical protein
MTTLRLRYTYMYAYVMFLACLRLACLRRRQARKTCAILKNSSIGVDVLSPQSFTKSDMSLKSDMKIRSDDRTESIVQVWRERLNQLYSNCTALIILLQSPIPHTDIALLNPAPLRFGFKLMSIRASAAPNEEFLR